MIRIAEKNGYILYYDGKYDDYLIVTPKRRVTRYWKRLDNETLEYFNEKISKINKENLHKYRW